MGLRNRIPGKVYRKLQKILEKFKAFNKKHRKLLPFIVYLEIAVIVIVSLFGYLKRHLKVVIPVVLVICLIAVAVKCAADSGGIGQQESEIETDANDIAEAGESSSDIFEAVNESGTKDKSEESENIAAGDLESADVSDEEAKSEEAENRNTDNSESANVSDEEAKSDETENTEITDADNSDAVSENQDEAKSEEAEDVASYDQESATESDALKEPDTSADPNAAKDVEPEDDNSAVVSTSATETTDTAAINEKTALLQEKLIELKEEYPETAAWIWFEDDLISQPVMQSGDNQKYADLDNTGTEADTGSIFFDYRSKADLSDPNTIIYGHNMRDYTMFGAFKYYKNNNDFLKDHKYIRIITPDNIYRYMIFAYMGVPENSEIYNVCGDSSDKMRQFLDTIEYRTYIDTGIEPSVDDKIITLSTCTKSDQLNFIMFAVRVSE